MKASLFPIQSRKSQSEADEVISYKLFTQAGFIIKHGAGLYTYGPFAQTTLEILKSIIREELNRIDCFEIAMPFVQPASLWKESGRWEKMGPEMARFEDRKEGEYALSPTHEEVVTDVFRRTISSVKMLPTCLYQIGTKFRDEIRPRFGLLRGREFLMMDAYSFHTERSSLDAFYSAMHGAYEAILRRSGVRFVSVEADVGNMGGDASHEFHILASTGEDLIVTCSSCGFVSNAEVWGYSAQTPESLKSIKCPKCSSLEFSSDRGIEVGHIFKLGTKYTESMSVALNSADGGRFFPTMGCYGIGVSRLLASIIEQNHDERGMIWPESVAPYQISIIDGSKPDSPERTQTLKLYEALRSQGRRVFWDERDLSFGAKMRDWELYGFPTALIAGRDFASQGLLEVRKRSDLNQKEHLSVEDAITRLLST